MRRSWQLVRTLHFQNPYGVDGSTPDQHKIKMGLDGHPLILPVDLKLRQNMQAQRCQSLSHAGFKPVPSLQGQKALQTVSGGQHLAGKSGTRTFPVLPNVAHAHIGGPVAQMGDGTLLRNHLQPLTN
ncbi:hypothetical protein SDC9_178055 [bioreactor metagenome]|uniref:Uncharacterized protein n=1 Tax=bioreactor metagenome TaxID=1076179 RepID=A0A645H2L1_9ZZZZ